MSAWVTQLPSSCTRAAGVAATAAGCARCFGAGVWGRDPLAVGALMGRDGRRPFSLLRGELAMATDILRQIHLPFTPPKPIAPTPEDLLGSTVLVVDDELAWREFLANV